MRGPVNVQWALGGITALAFVIGTAIPIRGAGPDEAAARLVRVFSGDADELLDMSADGRFLLARGSRKRKCTKKKGDCQQSFLRVYSTETGRRVGQVFNEEEWRFRTARFVDSTQVEALEDGVGAPARLVRWRPQTQEESRAPLGALEHFFGHCFLDGGRLLGSTKTLDDLVIGVAGGAFRRVPPPLWVEREPYCRGWLAGSSLLMRYRKTTLWWVAEGAAPPRRCEQFSGTLHNYAVSPDQTLLAVVTSEGVLDRPDDYAMGPTHRVFLHLLSGSTCQTLRRFELQFPERPKREAPLLAPRNTYWANARQSLALAHSLAISPDNAKIALGYGIRTGGIYSDAVAYFGLYSLADGRRLATLRGDVLHNGFWVGLRMMDLVPTDAAPLQGALIFSPDSKMLFGTSRKLRQWDVSKLQ